MAHNVRNRLKLKTNESSAALNTTPVKSLSNDDKDYSPMYLACTQESMDNVDVLWDWNSPQSKLGAKRRPKRILNPQKSSPKLPIKKHTNSTSSHRTFDKIKDELQAFREDIDSGPVLDLDDAELDFGCHLNNNEADITTHNISSHKNELNDFFDDSLEQELLMVSQQVEEKLKQDEICAANENCKPASVNVLKTPARVEPTKTESPRTLTKSFSSNTLFDSPLRTPNRPTFDFKGKLQQLRMRDSFDLALGELDDDLEAATAKHEQKLEIKQEKNVGVTSPAAGTAASTKQAANIRNETKHSLNSSIESPLKFKTKSLSFGHSYVKKTNEEVMREEIEKKRLAALAKLRAKKSTIPTVLSDSDSSPIKCSPEEIENKRKQALARLEQKKQQELIERNRLEALKRLEKRRQNRRP